MGAAARTSKPDHKTAFFKPSSPTRLHQEEPLARAIHRTSPIFCFFDTPITPSYIVRSFKSFKPWD